MKNRKIGVVFVMFLISLLLSFNSNLFAGGKNIPSVFTATKPTLANDKEAVSSDDSKNQYVAVDWGLLKTKRQKNKKVSFDFLGKKIVAERKKLSRGYGGALVWHGKPEEDKLGSVTLSFCGNACFGRLELPTADGATYKIEPVKNGNGVHRIFKEPVSHALIDDGGISPPKTAIDSSLSAIASSAKVDDGSVIDILVLYTASVKDKYTEDELTARINYLVGFANTCYINSEIDNLELRIVGTKEVGFDDSQDPYIGDTLDRLVDGEGVFSDVKE
ncbi:MAG: hypothetical protein HYV59_09095 [Planctomycetes bacterium]|nr:hypothetical protein [Planctomycetota bacterium]